MSQLPTSSWWQRLSRRFLWHPTPQQQADSAWRRLQRQCPPAVIAARQIPPSIRLAWEAEVERTLPGMAVDNAAWVRCAVGLAQFFEASRLQRDAGPCALPSRAADAVWHAWLRSDPAGLAEWQQRFFNRVIEHRESAGLASLGLLSVGEAETMRRRQAAAVAGGGGSGGDGGFSVDWGGSDSSDCSSSSSSDSGCSCGSSCGGGGD